MNSLAIGLGLGPLGGRIGDSTPPAAEAILLIVAGQSNARTAETNAGSAPSKYATLSDAHMWVAASGAFAAYSAGPNSDSKGGSGCWGSEAEFIFRVNQHYPGRAVYVVKEAMNGATMANTGTNSWLPTGGGARFGELADQVAQAKAALAGIDFEDVILFNQGEGDTESATYTDAYKANALAFLVAVRATISTGLFVFERIRPYSGDLANKPYGRTYAVRAAQEEVAAADVTVGIIDLDFSPANFAVLHPGPAWAEGKGLRAFARWNGTYDATYGPIADRTPGNLSFAGLTDASQNTIVTSGTVTIADIGGGSPVSIVGGEYRVRNPDGTAWVDWTSAAGTIHPFQSLQLRVAAAASPEASVNVVVTVGTTSETWTVTTGAQVVDYEAETVAFLATVSTVEGDSMTTAQSDALDAFYVVAKASTWWPKFHRLYVGALHDEVASSIDLVDQTTRMTQAGNTGNVTWAAGSGWGTGGGQGRGLDMWVNPATATAQDSIALLLWCNDFTPLGGSDAAFDIQGSDISVRMRQNASGNLQGRLHSGGNQTLAGVTGAGGLRLMSRTGPTTTTYYGPAGTALSTSAAASAARTATKLYLFAPITGSTSERHIAVCGISDGLSGPEVTGLRAALAALIAAFAA